MQYPDINPNIFEIFGFPVRWYGVMYLIGFALAFFLLRWRAANRKDWEVGEVEDLIFYGALGVIVGGRLGYVFFYQMQAFLADPVYLIKINEGGMSFHGGLLGVLAGMWWFARKTGRRLWAVTDFLAPGAPLGLFFGRIGNFINGELWGKPTDLPWGFIVNGVKLHPSQLYEAFLEGLVLFTILWIYSSRPRPTMSVSGLFLFFYGIFRFAVEFVREPDVDKGYILFERITMGQILSTPMIIAGVILFVLAHRRAANDAVAGAAR